jgi:hypothetical protein
VRESLSRHRHARIDRATASALAIGYIAGSAIAEAQQAMRIRQKRLRDAMFDSSSVE